MTKDEKFEIGLTLNKIAMLLSDEDFHKVKDLLKHVEQIVAEQTEPQTSVWTSGVVWTEDAIKNEPKSYSSWASTDEPQTERSK